jgi:hypothetical protein
MKLAAEVVTQAAAGLAQAAAVLLQPAAALAQAAAAPERAAELVARRMGVPRPPVALAHPAAEEHPPGASAAQRATAGEHP